MDNGQLLYERYLRTARKYAERDIRNEQIRLIREGKISEVAPDLFPEAGPLQEPIIANTIDLAARDAAEMLAPMPAFNCSSPSMVTETARRRATEKTKVVTSIATHSKLQVQLYNGADQYLSYGMMPIRADIDFDNKMVFLKVMNPLGFYPAFDRWNRLVYSFHEVRVSKWDLAAQYPEWGARIIETPGDELTVIFYHDKNEDIVLLPGGQGNSIILSRVRNPLGRPMISVSQRPGATAIPRGQFDDVIFVQLARSRFALLNLQAATDSVDAPLVVPNDVGEIPFGPGATIRTQDPTGVHKVKLDVPREVFAETAQLSQELMQGARFPGVRTGNTDSAIVTGKGVQALMGGYDSQIRAHQAIFAATLQEVMGIALELDEKIFGGKVKEVKGAVNGTPFSVAYDPAKVIRGDYTVDVRYGLMAGLDPNRWLVFGLQARAEKLFSRDFMRREMPVDIDAEEEARKVDLEDLEESAKMAIQGYAQAIPALASQGQDPSGPIQALAKVIELRRKGVSIADAVVTAFTPEPEPETPAEQAAEGGVEEPGEGQQGRLAPGMTADGRMDGVAAGQMGELPGGRPDLKMMLAGLDSRGGPNLQATVSRQKAF